MSESKVWQEETVWYQKLNLLLQRRREDTILKSPHPLIGLFGER
jgi:hypothetical protein